MLLVVHHVSEIWVTTSFTNFYNDHISKFEATGSWDLNPHKIYWHQFIGTDITDSIDDTFPYIAKLSKCRQKSQNLEVSTALLCWRQIFRRYFFLFWCHLENYTYFCLFSPIVYCKIFQSKKNHGGQDHSCGDVNLNTLSFERKSWPIEKSQRFSTFEHSFLPGPRFDHCNCLALLPT